MESSSRHITEFFTTWVIPLGIICTLAVVLYLGLLAYIHLRAKAGYNLYLYVKKEVRALRKAKEEGEEGTVDILPGWEEMEKLLADILRKEHILRDEEKSPDRPAS